MEIDYSRKWVVMLAVGMGVFLATIDGSIVNVALPTLETAYHTNFPTIQWVVLAYLLGVTTLMLGIGRFADMRGKKPIYTIGFVIFTLGSLLCGLAPTVYALIGFRVLQSVGAAMIMALGTAIVTEAFPASERGKALGITGTIVSVGIVIGPMAGSLILAVAPWNWIFYVNLPVGVIGTFLVLRNVPAIRPPGGQRFDFWGAFTMFAGLFCLLLSLTLGQQIGFTDPLVLGLALAFVIFLVAFISLELHLQQPMLDLRLFRNREFSINLVTGFLTFVCISGTILLMPFYLENVLGLAPSQVGPLMSVIPALMAFIAPVSGWLSDRLGTRPITVAGLAILVVGYAALSFLSTTTSNLQYVLLFLPIGLGMGIFQSPNNSAIMGTAPRERLGIVSGMLAVNRTLGQTTGIAVLGAVWSSFVYASTGGPLPGGATDAPPAIQVAGMQQTFWVMIILIGFALVLGVWGLVSEKRKGQK